MLRALACVLGCYTAQLHSLKTHDGAARRVVTSGAKMRAAYPELGKARAACLYSVGRQHGKAVIQCYGNVTCYD